jgi:hypothetical protein
MLFRLILLFVSLCVFTQGFSSNLKVLQMNIWAEGTKVEGGYDAIVEEIVRLKPDVVLLSEVRNYNNVMFISRLKNSLKEKGQIYYGDNSDTDVGIISKYPITEQCVLYPLDDDSGSVLKAEIWVKNKRVIIYSVHLDYKNYACYLPRGYDGITWGKMKSPITDVAMIEKMNKDSKRDEEINCVISDAAWLDSDLIIIGGDFNEPSYLDWREDTRNFWDHRGVVIDWDCSILLEKASFTDSYRLKYPNPVTHPGFTFPSDNPSVPVNQLAWAPDADERDRIDYIYFKSSGKSKLVDVVILGPNSSIIRGQRCKETSKDKFILPKNIWPTDHKAIVATFKL